MLLESEAQSHLNFQTVAIVGLVGERNSRASSLTGGCNVLFLIFCKPYLEFVKFSVKPGLRGFL